MRPVHGLAILVFALSSACAPKNPVLTPQSIQITGVGTAGMRLRTDLSAYNPNGFDLTLQTVSGRIVLDNSVPLGGATTVASVLLPSEGTQRFFVDLEIPWLNLPSVLALAQTKPLVPYVFEGEAVVGGTISITLPIRMEGMIPAQDLMRASIGLPRFGLWSDHTPPRSPTMVIRLQSESGAEIQLAIPKLPIVEDSDAFRPPG